MLLKNKHTDNKMIKKPEIINGIMPLKPAGFFSAIVMAFFLSAVLYSQPESGAELKTRGTEAFSKGDFVQALDDFGQLLKVYPADPLYKYYYGASLVMLEEKINRASSMLTEAMEGRGIKSVPDDGWFYLGRARQLSGEYDEAIEAFKTFSDVAGKKQARERDTELYIKQCRNHEGLRSFETIMAEGTGSVVRNSGLTGDQAAVSNQGTLTSQRREGPREYLPEEDDRLLADAFGYQSKADSLQKVVSDSKAKPVQKTGDMVTDGDTRVADAQKAAALNQEAADRIFSGLEGNNKIGPEPENTVTVADSNKSGVLPSAPPALNMVQEKQDEKVQEQSGSTAIFEIIQGRVFSPEETIEMNPEVPPGLVYRIQMAVFRNPVSPSLFRGINPVYGIRAEGTDITYYYAGYFRKITDAQKALILVRQEGLKDSFIVSVMDGKAVSQERAAILEKEWGNISFTTGTEKKITPPKEETPPELSYRVEITRSEKALPDDIVEGYRVLSGKRGFEILNSDDAKVVYLIGKFITFESAEDFAGLLRRNGYSDARVSAWLGKREIPVETAKQLFEMTE